MSFSEDRLATHLKQLRARCQDPFVELLASYKILAMDKVKTHSAVLTEVERARSDTLRQVQNEFIEKLEKYKNEKVELEIQKKDEQAKAAQLAILVETLVRSRNPENRDIFYSQ